MARDDVGKGLMEVYFHKSLPPVIIYSTGQGMSFQFHSMDSNEKVALPKCHCHGPRRPQESAVSM
jgi:hypothetical protein